jgi:hypothetical protein
MSRALGCALSVAVVGFGAEPAAGQLDTRFVVGSLSAPLYVTYAPGGGSTVYVVERGGRIKAVNPTAGTVNPTPFLDLNTIPGTQLLSGGEQGLLGLAFHPNFQNPASRFLYVNYTWGETGTPGNTRVERYTMQANGAVDTASRQTVMEFAQPFNNHNGGWLGFHPTNGLLYIASGDGGDANDPQNNGQRTDTLLGKMLRVDVNADAFPADPNRNYAIPAGNIDTSLPNPNNPVGSTVAPEIWAYGLRNPWRASFDRANGNMYIGDVGQNTREEIDFVPNGFAGTPNFGWRLREGTVPTPTVGGPQPPGNVEPIKDHPHPEARSITGGYVYRGPVISDNGQPLDGTYIYADFVTGKFWSFRYDGTTLTDFRDRTDELGTSVEGSPVILPSSFGEDEAGNLYVFNFNGAMYQIVPAPVPEPAAVLVVAAPVLAWQVRRRWPAGRPGRKPTRHPNSPDPGRVVAEPTPDSPAPLGPTPCSPG